MASSGIDLDEERGTDYAGIFTDRRMLYVLASICALGTLSTLVTGSLYKRLIKETGNMALTKDKNLKALKQRMENVFLINHGIRNVNAYIEKQLYGFRFMHMSLDGGTICRCRR